MSSKQLTVSAVSALLLILAIVSCGKDGQIGPEGPRGEQGIQGIQGIRGEKGEDGTTIYSGTVVPPANIGVVGDFYFRTSNSAFYGPKTAEGWGAPVSLRGSTGQAGSRILSGTAVPATSLGAVGDFYLRTSNAALYGPKTASGWPNTFVSLRGPAGNANVIVKTVTLTNAQYANGSIVDQTLSGWVSRNARIATIQDPALTQAIMDNGFVLVYIKTPINLSAPSVWTPMPYQRNAFGDVYTIHNSFSQDVGTLRIYYYFARNQAGTMPSVFDVTVPTTDFKYVITSGHVASAARQRGYDITDTGQLIQYLKIHENIDLALE